MSQSASHHPPIPLKRLDYTLPPKVDGKKWVVHRRQAKLIQPRNAGAFPALSGGNKAIGSDVSLFHRSPRPQVSKESGELTFLLMPSVPSDYEHTRPVHFICTSAISQKELDDKIKDPG